MIDLTPLLDRLDAADVPAQEDTPEELAAKIADVEAIVQALVTYLGLDWCSDCADVHQPDSHTMGSRDQSGLPGAQVVSPGP